MTTSRRVGLWLEMSALFVVAPGLLAMAFHRGWLSPRWLFPGMWLLALTCALLLARDPACPFRHTNLRERVPRRLGVVAGLVAVGAAAFALLPGYWRLIGAPLVVLAGFLLLDLWFDRRLVWNVRGARRDVPRVLVTFLVGALLLGVTLWAYEPERLFILARERPQILALIATMYPLLSVWPQELAFRVFFFHRYAELFARSGVPTEHRTENSRWAFLLLNALVFAWAHIVMLNPLALVICVPGGLLFAYTYARTRSLAAVWLEHALYGVWIFTVGWGWYFFAGARILPPPT